MAMNLGSSGKSAAVMNVTPLIDVLLVLLIIFMILTPLTPMGENALIPREPQSKGNDYVPPRTIVLQILQDPSGMPMLRINDELTAWDDLRARLEAIYQNRTEKVMFVKADHTVEWEPIANAIDIAHRAGVVNVGLM